jgi:hypothetical protein
VLTITGCSIGKVPTISPMRLGSKEVELVTLAA